MSTETSATRAVVAEALATGLLVAAVVGSGIMADRLSGGVVGLALLANTLATAGALVALILAFGPISGAHLNPVVTAHAALTGALPRPRAAAYVVAQVAGGIAGAVVANAMFGLDPLALSGRVRTGGAQWLSEAVATAGLVAVVLSTARHHPARVPVAVAAYITAAYWFTASTSFANPAVTVARMFSDSFAGIRPADAPGFVAAQLVGGAVGAAMMTWLLGPARGADAGAAPPEEHP
jgi:glycerol uptake facilitator-like aquaporin